MSKYCRFETHTHTHIIDGGVNLKVWALTGTWGICSHRNAKIWGKKGDFAKIWQKLGAIAPSAPQLRRPCIHTYTHTHTHTRAHAPAHTGSASLVNILLYWKNLHQVNIFSTTLPCHGIRTITPRTITPRTITPGQLPPRTNTPRTFTPPWEIFQALTLVFFVLIFFIFFSSWKTQISILCFIS